MNFTQREKKKFREEVDMRKLMRNGKFVPKSSIRVDSKQDEVNLNRTVKHHLFKDELVADVSFRGSVYSLPESLSPVCVKNHTHL